MVTCDEGFGILGTGTMTCGADGTFYQTPTCEGPCTRPVIPNGSVNPSDGTVEYGSTYDVTCDEGFGIIHGTGTMTCGAGGNFDQKPTCGKYLNFVIVNS